jgi:hypothetical protein
MEQALLVGVCAIAALGLVRRARATLPSAPETPADPSVDVEVRLL